MSPINSNGAAASPRFANKASGAAGTGTSESTADPNNKVVRQYQISASIDEEEMKKLMEEHNQSYVGEAGSQDFQRICTR